MPSTPPPVTVREKMLSQSGQRGPNASAELLYDIEGTDDGTAALDALQSVETGAPTSWDGLARNNCSVEPVLVTGDGNGLWTGRASYEPLGKQNLKPIPETGDRVITFETGGGTTHITQSIATVGSYAPAGLTAPDHKGAIGVKRDSGGASVEGCDVVSPGFRFTVTAYIASADIDATYIGKLFALTGKTNNDEFTVTGFGTFDTHELLFLGASGSQRGDGSDWEIQWQFAASPTLTGLTVGDITGVNKDGWDYLWVQYEEVLDEDTNMMVQQPRAAYTEMVYEDGDFGDLEPT